MISKEEFREKSKNIIPKEELQKIEEDKKKKKLIKTIVILIELLFFIILAFTSSYFWIISIPFTILISILIINAIFLQKWEDLKIKYGKEIISILLDGIEYSYNPKGFIDRNIFNESRFCINNYDKYTGEDLLIVDIPKNDGTPSGVKFNICDLNVTKEETRTVTQRNADGTTSTKTEHYTVTLYDKAFGFVEFPFQFKCNLSLNHNAWDLKKIQLEDIKFNKQYNVYTDNQLEALVILTPVMMTKLMELSKKIKGFKIKITKTGKMYIGMSRNLFSLKVSDKVPIDSLFDGFYEDICSLLLIINEIKDNDKVFKI
jgi:hypothetical protein